VPDLVTGAPALPEIAPAIDAVARLLVRTLAADGVNLLSSSGAAAGQEVFHLHVHVVPRWHDDGLFSPRLIWKRRPYRDEDERKAVRDAIRTALETT
jgi:histidine triad (HIT) family protein